MFPTKILKKRSLSTKIVLDGTNHPTSDLSSGIARWLCMKIIRHLMDDHRASHNLINGKAPIKEGHPGIALIAQERRHITGMIWMFLHVGIVVIAGMGKILGAVAYFMDVKPIEIRRKRCGDIRKTKNLRLHQYTAVGSIVKLDQAADLRRGRRRGARWLHRAGTHGVAGEWSVHVSTDPGHGAGTIVLQ